MGTFWFNSGGIENNAATYTDANKYTFVDPLVTLFTNKNVTQVLLTLSLVSVVMVIVAAIIKIIQSEFSTEGSKNSKAGIFGQALKCLVLFFAVPVCCVGGVLASNALLRTIDRATSLAGEGSTIGSQILVSAASQQNIVRQGKHGDLSDADWAAVGVTSPPTITDTNREQYAIIIDTAFRSNKVIQPNSFWGYQEVATVEKYYDVVGMNFVTLIGGALLAAYTMLMASFGMVMRLFKATVLYVISPPIIALMPLDGGSAFKSWRTSFLGQVLAAYGTIVSLNLLFILLPVVNNINLFGDSDFPGVSGSLANGHIASTFNSFCHLIFTLTGLFMLKDISSMISKMIGAEDAAASGSSVAAKVGGTAMAIAGGVGGAALKGVGSLASIAAKKNPNSKSAKVFGAIGNTLGKAGSKGTQKLKGTMGKMFNDSFGAVTGFSMDTQTDPEKAREATLKKREERKKAVEAGTAGIGGVLMQKFSDTGFGKGTIGLMDNLESGGTTTIARAGEIRQQTVANQIAGAQAMQADADRNKKIAEITDTSSGTSLVSQLEAAMQSMITATTAKDKFAASDRINGIIEAIKEQGGTFEEMKDLLIRLGTVQTRLNSSTNATQMQNYIKSLMDGTGPGAHITDITSGGDASYAHVLHETAKANATEYTKAIQNDFAVTVNPTTGEMTATARDGIVLDGDQLEKVANQIAGRIQVVKADGSTSTIDPATEQKRMLTEIKKKLSELADDKK